MNREYVVKRSRDYLVKIGYSELEVYDYTDTCVLGKVNMLYFGGIQAFARRVEKEEASRPPLKIPS